MIVSINFCVYLRRESRRENVRFEYIALIETNAILVGHKNTAYSELNEQMFSLRGKNNEQFCFFFFNVLNYIAILIAIQSHLVVSCLN